MAKTVFISQSNYIPWKGYFDAIDKADVFVIYDIVQYTNRDWRNRNLIKTSHGLQWLSLPVHYIQRNQPINTIREAGKSWRKKHLKTIEMNYSRAPYFDEFIIDLRKLYQIDTELLTKINEEFILFVCAYLGIQIEIIRIDDWELPKDRTQRLVHICRVLGANEYLSGPTAKDYIDEDQFAEKDIKLTFMDYSGYPEYPQLFGPFEHGVSVIDLLMNTGPNAIDYIRKKHYQ